jgi:TM2 domain-containing membrane protein YozV
VSSDATNSPLDPQQPTMPAPGDYTQAQAQVPPAQPEPGHFAPPPGQPAPDQAQYGQQYGQPQYGQAQYGQPQYGQAPQVWQQPGAPVAVAAVQPKSPALCLLVSFFIPGVGSIIAGNTNTGVLILILYIVSWVLTIFLIGILGVIGFWVWGLIDAYQSAQKWNAAHGIIS